MKRFILMALFGLAIVAVGTPVMAQPPMAGQPYQVPAGYETYPAGTLISYGGYSYVSQGNGTMVLSQQPAVAPPAPGGFVTGNPSPYDPNAVVGGSSVSTGYWDPYRGWVTDSSSTTVLNSALSPGRAPMPGTSVQYYNYWDGNQWVRGERWLGQDGLWHGRNTGTTFGPTGSTSRTTVYYSPGARGTNTATTYYGRGYSQPSFGQPGMFGLPRTR